MNRFPTPAAWAALLVLALAGGRAGAQEPAPKPPAEEPAGPPAPPPAEPSPPGSPAEPAPARPAPVEPQPPAQPAPAEPPPIPEDEAARQGWIDESHAAIERGLGQITERIDTFFGDERSQDPDPERAGSTVRWRNEVRTAQDKPFAFRTSLSASVRLPATQRWLKGLRVVISGESQRDPNRALSDDPSNPGFSPVVAAEQASLELRLPIVHSGGTVLEAGTGLRLRIPPEPYVRTRLRQRVPLGLGVTLRLSPEVSWESRDGFGTAAGADLDRPLGLHTTVRWKNHAQLTEVSKGVEWGTELGLGHEIVPWRTGVFLGAAANGDTRPREEVLFYRLFTRVRRDVWRRWLFLELEPEVGWPLRPDGTRPRVLALTLRVDVRFDGQAPPPGLEARRRLLP